MIHLFWLLVFIVGMSWYMCVTVIVGVKGAKDIRRMMKVLLPALLFGGGVRAQEYIGTAEALRQYQPPSWMAFPETRNRPIHWMDSLRPEWLDPGHGPFVLRARPGEYFIFQVGVWAARGSLDGLIVRCPTFWKGTATCFNSGGVDYTGRSFTRKVDVPAGRVQAFWLGIKVPDSARGAYDGSVRIGPESGPFRSIPVRLEVSGAVPPDHGFDEPWRLSRLFWLNSTVGEDDRVTKGYAPVTMDRRTLHVLGRSLRLAPDGLPAAVTTYFTSSNQSIAPEGSPILDSAFRFIIRLASGQIVRLASGPLRITGRNPSEISWTVSSTSDICDVTCRGALRFDGSVRYQLVLRARSDLHLADVRLEAPMRKDKAVYMMGLGKEGGLRPRDWRWKWDTTKNQDALWLGAVNGGLRLQWLAENYRRPLVNVYYSFGRLRMPASWGGGGVTVAERDRDVLVSAYSGPRSLRRGDSLRYDFNLLITPFHTMNREVQFGDRYYHSGSEISRDFLKEADSLGANIVNVHQGNDLYPFINYPYSDANIRELAAFIEAGHQDHKKVKVYYTTRELTVNLPELLPFMSLNGEVVFPGPGADAKTVLHPDGPDPWLKMWLRGYGYIPAWVSPFTEGRFGGLRDISVITTPDSRLYNFYIGGLDWMERHLHIDGVYIDDCSLDRTTLERARKILDDARPEARIDMHSWNHFTASAGFASCLNLYMDLLPFIDLVWIGEARNYDTPPDYWLTEIAGIPFGLPGQMLQDGGNPWRGMVYGITNRPPWSGTAPDAIWRFWDDFGLEGKRMIGYWDTACPVTCGNPALRVTVFKGRKTTVLALGNFSAEDQPCALRVNYNRLGYSQAHCTFSMPAIFRYQEGRPSVDVSNLTVPAKKGFLIVIQNKP